MQCYSECTFAHKCIFVRQSLTAPMCAPIQVICRFLLERGVSTLAEIVRGTGAHCLTVIVWAGRHCVYHALGMLLTCWRPPQA